LAALQIIQEHTYKFTFRGHVSNFPGNGVRKKVKCAAEFCVCSTMHTAPPSTKQTTSICVQWQKREAVDGHKSSGIKSETCMG